MRNITDDRVLCAVDIKHKRKDKKLIELREMLLKQRQYSQEDYENTKNKIQEYMELGRMNAFSYVIRRIDELLRQ